VLAELVLAVPEAAALELMVLVSAVRVPVPEAAVQPVVPVAEEPVQAVLVLQALAEVEQPAGLAEAVQVARPVQVPPEWVAAQVEPLRPARAMARPVPVSVEAAVETVPLAQWVRRVRSVRLLDRRAWALPQAVAHPMGRRRMGRPPVQMARSEGLGVGRGATSWRPLVSRRSRAPTSCVLCTSSATSLRAPQTA